MFKAHRRALLSAAAILSVGLTSLALSVPANADVDADFVQSSNASDPSAFPCQLPSTSTMGYCLVTSTDMHMTPVGAGTLAENYYPMQYTQVFYSSDGLKWTRGNGLNESSLPISSTTWHMWAPTVRPVEAGIGPGRPTTNFYLYTPDLTNPSDRFSSRIWLTYSSSINTAWGTTPIYGLASGAKNIQIQGIPTAADINTFKDRYPLYMSDPSVFVNTTASDRFYVSHENDDWLLWADGDYSSCGGLSIRKMTNHWTVQQFHNPNEAWLDIQGLNSGRDALGTCTKRYPSTDLVNIGRPYIEGGELYHSSQFSGATTANEGLPGPYFVVFAAKPERIPDRCQTSSGEPGTDNEVIAYATANSVTGPYYYGGIIMCGSATEWTNQATIEQVKASDGSSRLVLIYHDGPDASTQGNTRNRALHAECLYSVDNTFVKTMRSSDGVASLSGGRSWCLANPKITALTSVSNGLYVNVNGSGNLQAAGQDVGIWEQLSRSISGNYVYFKARNGNKYVGTSTTQLNANQTSQTTAARFTVETISGTKVRIKDSSGRYIQTQANGVLKANSTAPSSSDTTYQFWLQTLTN